MSESALYDELSVVGWRHLPLEGLDPNRPSSINIDALATSVYHTT